MKFQNQLEIMLYHGYISMKNKPNMLNTHSSIGFFKRPKYALFKDNKERGLALSFLGLQSTIFTSDIPQDFSGEETSTPKARSEHKMAQNEVF